jgi:phage terminase small subunit
MTPKQQRFVEEYLLDLCATKAAIRAGYKEKNAKQIGSHLLAHPNVAAAIAAAQASRAERTRFDQDRVLDELELLAFSNLEHYIVDDNGQVALSLAAPAGAMRALQSIKRKVTIKPTRWGGEDVTREVEIKLWDKPGPLKLAGQHVGLFVEKHEHTGKNGKPIEVVKKVVVFGGRHRKQPDAAKS